MQLFIKTELKVGALAEGVHKGFCSSQKTISNPDKATDKIFIGYLIPPNIGELILYKNAGTFSVPAMTAWHYYVQVENLPVLTKQQEEIVWTQLKMSCGFLRVQKIASEVKAVKSWQSELEGKVAR